MKNKLNWIGLALTAIGALLGLDASVLLAAGVITPADGIAAGSITTGSAATEAKTRAEAPDMIYDSVDSVVTKIRPSRTPLVSILMQMKAKAKKAETMRFSYYSIDVRPNESTLTAAAAQAAAGYTNVTVANSKIFDKGDTVRIVDNAGVEVFGLVTAVNPGGTANTLTVQVCYDDETGAQPAFPAVADGATIYRLGSSCPEEDVRTVTYSALPSKETNYCQIFKMEVGETTIQKLSRKEVDWSLTDIEEQAMYEWKRAMEGSFLFGQKGHFQNATDNKTYYTTGGIVPTIIAKGKNLVLGTAGADLTNDDLIDLCKSVFVGNCGSEKRLLFAGSEFIAELSKINLVQKQMEATNTTEVFGIQWNSIVTNFGELLLLHHPALDDYGFTKKALVIDPQFVDKYTFIPVKRESLDLQKSGDFWGDVNVTTEVCGVALRYPSCHAVVSIAE